MPFDHVDAIKFTDERTAVAQALAARPLNTEERQAVRQEAMALVRSARRGAKKQAVVESFVQEFSLSTREGLALTCLAAPPRTASSAPATCWAKAPAPRPTPTAMRPPTPPP